MLTIVVFLVLCPLIYVGGWLFVIIDMARCNGWKQGAAVLAFGLAVHALGVVLYAPAL